MIYCLPILPHQTNIIYAICVTGLLASVALHEDDNRALIDLQRKCGSLETERDRALAEVRLCRRNLLTSVHSLDRMALDQFLAGRLRDGYATENYYQKADQKVLLAYIDLLTGQLRKHVKSPTDEQIIQEQLEFRKQYPIKE